METYKIADDIRKEIATAIVKQSEPDYYTEYFGESYAVDTDGDNILDTVYFRQANAPWDPWHDNATAFSVDALFADSDRTFDPTPDPDLQPDDLNDEEYAEIVFAETVVFALEELPDTFEPLDEDEQC